VNGFGDSSQDSAIGAASSPKSFNDLFRSTMNMQVENEVIDAFCIVGFWPKRNVDASPKKLLEWMDRYSIDRACVSHTRGILYEHDEGNRLTAEIASGNERFIGCMTVNPLKSFDPTPSLEMGKRLGLRMLTLFPDLCYAPFSPRQNHVKPIIEGAEELGLPVMIPGEGRLYTVTDMGEVAEEHADAVFLLRDIGYVQIAEFIATAKAVENIYLVLNKVNTPDCIELMAREIGADRIVYGSNAPLEYPKPVLEMIERAGISEEEKTLIKGGNMKRILRERR